MTPPEEFQPLARQDAIAEERDLPDPVPVQQPHQVIPNNQVANAVVPIQNWNNIRNNDNDFIHPGRLERQHAVVPDDNERF